jgi:hypothetical protein
MIIDDPETLAEVTSAFEAYERALMANDVGTLDSLFWASPQALRYGVAECLYGHEAILAFRKARPGGSPQRQLTRTVITTFGKDFAVANAEFRRIGATRSGRQSQTWVRFREGWRIVAAHVSLIGDSH